MKGEKNPEELIEEYRRGELDRDSIIKVFISFIEESEDSKLRLESLELLNELEFKDPRIIKLLQNLLISDSDESIRGLASKVLIEQFLPKS
ncbi:MAG: hypothetical protein ACW96X_10930, partial [Promethearchaeota archaeon]